METAATEGGGLIHIARDLLAQGPLCDACLGRPVADRSHGLTNAERGRSLRVGVALSDDRPMDAADIATPEAGECWVCMGVCDAFDDWADAVEKALDGIGFATYQVGTRVPPLIEENERLLREDAGLAPDAGEPINREVNREVGKRVGVRLDDPSVDRERPDVVATLDLDRDPASGVDIRINPAFVYGRYRKEQRGIPQTRWPCRECDGAGEVLRDGTAVDCEHCDGVGKLYQTSVEELVAPPIVAAMDGTDGTFHGAGREDVDARMLGDGRPFVVEVAHPRSRTPDIDALQAAIADRTGDRASVRGLRLATHGMVERVKELPARKRYRAVVAFDEPVADDALRNALDRLDGATIEQRTPQRVDHRRADRVRERTVYAASGRPGVTDDVAVPAGSPDGDMAAEAVPDERSTDRTATITVETEGGLYVKELVSGDDGRSEPSLADLLGVDATVIALDVLAVEGEAEPFEDPAFVRE